MLNRTFYCGKADFVVKVNERESGFVELVRSADYVFFKNKDDEYEFLKTRYGDKSFLFLTLDDIRKYLSEVGKHKIKSFRVKKCTSEIVEKFWNIGRGTEHGI